MSHGGMTGVCATVHVCGCGRRVIVCVCMWCNLFDERIYCIIFHYNPMRDWTPKTHTHYVNSFIHTLCLCLCLCLCVTRAATNSLTTRKWLQIITLHMFQISYLVTHPLYNIIFYPYTIYRINQSINQSIRGTAME